LEKPILKGFDYYQAIGTNLYYYDVNSLYPYAMKKDIPYELIAFHKDLSNYPLKDFFGFCLAEIECPNTVKIPLLPYKHKGKTIFPKGKWIAVYFSEELKEVIKYGYKVKLINGYEFTKMDLFSDYVDHFYDKKKNAKLNKDEASKFIAKMQLNQLYGIFGRKQELIETVNIQKKYLIKYLTTRIVKAIININDNYSTLLISKNINVKILSQLNTYFQDKNYVFDSYQDLVKSNVAIASSITAYARIHMMYYKTKYNCFYTDTDSMFTSEKLPDF
jgi:hypothetical protein